MAYSNRVDSYLTIAPHPLNSTIKDIHELLFFPKLLHRNVSKSIEGRIFVIRGKILSE